jgi:hypothetical protein
MSLTVSLTPKQLLSTTPPATLSHKGSSVSPPWPTAAAVIAMTAMERRFFY